MEMLQIKCENCGRYMYVIDKYVRDKMFCTIGCTDTYKKTIDNRK